MSISCQTLSTWKVFCRATFAIVAASLLMTACAGQPNSPAQIKTSAEQTPTHSTSNAVGRKVQTYEELISKLKDGFYSGRFTEPEFYARELGYPLKAPLRYEVWNVQDEGRDQRIDFDEGQLKTTAMHINTESLKAGDRIFKAVWRFADEDGCYTRQQLYSHWGPNAKDLGTTQLPHVRRRIDPANPPKPDIPYFWTLSHTNGAQVTYLSFVMNLHSSCVTQASMSSRKPKE